MSIHDIVSDLVQKYGTDDPFELCRYLGVRVRITPLGSLKGLYTYIDNEPVILISSRLKRSARIVVCAHELGHHVLHSDIAENEILRDFSFFIMRDRTEYEANVFLADLLLSDDDLDELFKDGCTIDEASANLCLPSDIIRVKMEDMHRRGFSIPMPDHSVDIFG